MIDSLELRGIGMTSKRTRLRLIERLRSQGIRNESVLDVMEQTPRHIFLDEALAHRAYEDTALPIGYQQTISQPYIVARMTELVLESKPRRVLELGTGSGYQAAVLAQLVSEVYSVERIEPLLDKARERFRRMGLRNLSARHSDGTMGWPERGPFDVIIATAAPKDLPQELIRQLRDGGRMILPLGDKQQSLTIVTRRGSSYDQQTVEPVSFVPFLPGTVT